MLFTAIHHVAIISSDYVRSKYFYHELLGFPIIAEHYRADRHSYKLDLAIGKHCQIELFSFPNAPKRASYPEAQGLRHLAFAVEDVVTCKHQLEQKGITVEEIRIDETTGRLFTFFHDPDGLPLEIYQNKLESLC